MNITKHKDYAREKARIYASGYSAGLKRGKAENRVFRSIKRIQVSYPNNVEQVKLGWFDRFTQRILG